MDIIKSIEHEQLKNKIPDLKMLIDSVRVTSKELRKEIRERIQVFRKE